MLEIIKTITICETFILSLIYFESSKGYEVQYSNKEKILDSDGMYKTKRGGLKAFKEYLKTLIIEGEEQWKNTK